MSQHPSRLTTAMTSLRKSEVGFSWTSNRNSTKMLSNSSSRLWFLLDLISMVLTRCHCYLLTALPAAIWTGMAVMVAGVSSSVLRAQGLSDCGAGGSPIKFGGVLLTQTVPVVGRMFMDLTTTTQLNATVEDNLQIRKVTTRVTDNYQVPCLNGISGTCTVEFCSALTTYPDSVCTLFPADVPCSCPFLADVYVNPSAYVTFTSEWLAIEGGVNGDYITRTEIVSNIGTPEETILGCLLLEYALAAV